MATIFYSFQVRNNLETAVNQCVQAAGYEFDPQVQKVLIKAAKFGKIFAPDIPSKPYVQMCRILRVLNGVRCNKIGIPLTYSQYPFINKKIFCLNKLAENSLTSY